VTIFACGYCGRGAVVKLHTPNRDGVQFFCAVCEPKASLSGFVCPCSVCPRCDAANDDVSHPIDGLAGPCHECRYYEWWAVSGPVMDGRCPRSEAELEAWREHDNRVWAGTL
jgi:hypothetical protein